MSVANCKREEKYNSHLIFRMDIISSRISKDDITRRLEFEEGILKYPPHHIFALMHFYLECTIHALQRPHLFCIKVR